MPGYYGDTRYNSLYGDLDLNFLIRASGAKATTERNIVLKDLEKQKEDFERQKKKWKMKYSDAAKPIRRKLALHRLQEMKYRVLDLLSQALRLDLSTKRYKAYSRLTHDEISCMAYNIMVENRCWRDRGYTVFTVENLLELTRKTFHGRKMYRQTAGSRVSTFVERIEKTGGNRVVIAGHGLYDPLYGDELYPHSPHQLRLDRKKKPGQGKGRIEFANGKVRVPNGMVIHFYCPSGSSLISNLGSIIEGFARNIQNPSRTETLIEPYETLREGEYTENLFLGPPRNLTLNLQGLKATNVISLPVDATRCVPLSVILTRLPARRAIHWVACRMNISASLHKQFRYSGQELIWFPTVPKREGRSKPPKLA
jgi:hypothetical protein